MSHDNDARAHNDYLHHLRDFLASRVDWKHKTVYEIVSDGRMPCGQYPAEKESISVQDVTQLPSLGKARDIVIEYRCFGQLLIEKQDELYTGLKYLDGNCKRLAKGHVVIIESMGTNVHMPTVGSAAMKKMYAFLEENGYDKNIVKTDWRFESALEAGEIMGALFGADMKNDILKKDLTVIPEYTGVWVYAPTADTNARTSRKKYLFNL